LQPIDAGGIFGSLMRRHGKAEISTIQRQRTDFEPLMKWLEERGHNGGGIAKDKAQALRSLPEDARMSALESICAQDEKLARAFAKWRARFDFEWMREAVELFAKGEAAPALEMLETKGRLKLLRSQAEACEALIAAWAKDKTPLAAKLIIAATRAEVADLNAMARAILIERGLVDAASEIEVEIKRRDESKDVRRFGPGDRIVFTMNDRALGVANGVSGFVKSVVRDSLGPALVVELDEPNERGERVVRVPTSFGYFDLSYCLTNHKSQGQTKDSAYVLANPSMADREWTYVAASRSRFATTIFANAALLGLVDPESHRGAALKAKSRKEAIAALASRMRRSRAKGTSLDYGDAPDATARHRPTPARSIWSGTAELVARLRLTRPRLVADRQH
jgi:ATP-dependent exoDNAse (exonuclease V) alpha subunit